MLPNFKIIVERWKYNSKYDVYVSNLGRIKVKEGFLKFSYIHPFRICKYTTVKVKRKVVSLHRLVLETWNPKNNMETLTVDHIDGNPRNNKLENLEWVTKEENERRAKEAIIAQGNNIVGFQIKGRVYDLNEKKKKKIEVKINNSEIDDYIKKIHELKILNFNKEIFLKKVNTIKFHGAQYIRYCGMVVTPLYVI